MDWSGWIFRTKGLLHCTTLESYVASLLSCIIYNITEQTLAVTCLSYQELNPKQEG